jgi:hypothetical protein
MRTIRMAAFTNELTKEAGVWDKLIGAQKAVGSLFSRVPKPPVKMVGALNKGVPAASEGGWVEAARRFASPTKGIVKGWEHLSPRASSVAKARQQGATLEQLTPQVTQRLEAARKAVGGARASRNPLKLDAAKKELLDAEKLYQETFGGAGSHLAAPSATMGQAWRGGGVKGVAEELSRRGWTGSGNLTKYAPSTGKPLMVGFPLAFDIPAVVNAPEATRTGEGGAVERGLGAALGTAGMIGGVGTGFLPGLALWYAGHKIGGGAGRLIDRMRAGATVPEAVMAPSPEEAQSQLQNIARYYG